MSLEALIARRFCAIRALGRPFGLYGKLLGDLGGKERLENHEIYRGLVQRKVAGHIGYQSISNSWQTTKFIGKYLLRQEESEVDRHGDFRTKILGESGVLESF